MALSDPPFYDPIPRKAEFQVGTVKAVNFEDPLRMPSLSTAPPSDLGASGASSSRLLDRTSKPEHMSDMNLLLEQADQQRQQAELQRTRLNGLYGDLLDEPSQSRPQPPQPPRVSSKSSAAVGGKEEDSPFWSLKVTLSSMTQSVEDLQSNRELFFPNGPSPAWEGTAGPAQLDSDAQSVDVKSASSGSRSWTKDTADDAAPVRSSWFGCFKIPKKRSKRRQGHSRVTRFDEEEAEEDEDEVFRQRHARDNLRRIVGDGGGILPMIDPSSVKHSKPERLPALPEKGTAWRTPARRENDPEAAMDLYNRSQVQHLLQMQQDQNAILFAQMSAVQGAGDEIRAEMREQAKLYERVLDKMEAMSSEIARLSEQQGTLPGSPMAT